MSIAVQFQQVSRHYDQVKAVDDISLDIAEGEFFSMLGPSGSGKTTSLRLIAGFEQPSRGSIRIFGQEAAGLPPNLRAVNTVFQDYALFPHMSVLDNVAYGLVSSGMKKPRAREMDRRPANATEYRCDGNRVFYVRPAEGGVVADAAPAAAPAPEPALPVSPARAPRTRRDRPAVAPRSRGRRS